MKCHLSSQTSDAKFVIS
jgi:synaptosomal-associated protein 29